MQEVQVLDVGFYWLFPQNNLDLFGNEDIGDYLVMVTSFGSDCISSYGRYLTNEAAAHEVRWLMAEDAKDALTGYAYEIWHLVDDYVEFTEHMDTVSGDDASSDSDLLSATFVPIRRKSLPLYNCECTKWSDVLAWIGAMLPLIDMASYELKTSTV